MSAAAARQPATGPQASRGPVVRVKPYKPTFDLEPDLLRQVRVWSARHGLVGVAPVVRALIAELMVNPALDLAVEDAIAKAVRPAGTLTKTTYDLAPSLYRDLKEWAASHETTNVAVLRALMTVLIKDRNGAISTLIASAAQR